MRLRAAIVSVWMVLVPQAHAQEPPAAPPVPAIENRIAHLHDRLAALKPENPRSYFELGEEVAGEATGADDRRLARHLYVLALEITRRDIVPDPALPSSVCLALAAIAETDDEKRWLTALAEALAPEGTPDVRRIKTSTASRDPAAFDLATMLSYVRSGEGRRAATILNKPGVAQLLDKCDRILMPGVGGAGMVRKHIDDWPICAQCRNRRFIKDGAGVHLCPMCSGVPGPKMSADELVGHIRTEAILLSGQQRSWAGQVTSDYGSPLRELDPSEPAATYNVDPWKPLWRGGRWVADPDAPKPAAPPGGQPGAQARPDAATEGEGKAAKRGR